MAKGFSFNISSKKNKFGEKFFSLENIPEDQLYWLIKWLPSGSLREELLDHVIEGISLDDLYDAGIMPDLKKPEEIRQAKLEYLGNILNDFK